MISKKNIFTLLKSTFTVVVLYLIITQIDWNKVSQNLRSANFSILLLALLFNIIERIELTFKWNILIKVRGIIVSFWRLFVINAIGTFLGLFLPSSLGTDIVRGYYLSKNNSEKSVSISSVFVDRILGVFSLIAVGVITLFFANDLIKETYLKYYGLLVIITLLCGLYIFQLDYTTNFIQKIINKIKSKKISNSIIKLQQSLLEYKKHPYPIFISFGLSILVQITRVFTYYFIAITFNIQTSIIYFLLFIPIIMLVIMLPISIGGLGLKEGTFIAFFSLVGMSMENAALISFTNTIINTLVTSLGGVLYLFYKPTSETNTDVNH